MTCKAAMNGACKRTKRAEIERRTPTRRSAQWTGFRWKTTPRAQPTAVPANTANRRGSSVKGSSPECEHRGRGHEVQERGRQEDFPAEGHELIVSKAREGRPQPDVEEEEERQLDQEPDRTRGDRAVPGTEEDGDRDPRDDQHVRVLAEEIEREFHAGVFRVEPRHELRLGVR